MPKLYCNCYVFDITTKRNRKCKLKPKYTYENKQYCHVHINNTNFFYYIIKIQSTYRSYRHRNLVKKYKELPREVQCLILKKIRIDVSYEKFSNIISNIILNKTVTFINEYYLTENQVNYIKNTMNRYDYTNPYLIKFFEEIIYIIYLINKYKNILNILKF